jgi:hypothetical protein
MKKKNGENFDNSHNMYLQEDAIRGDSTGSWKPLSKFDYDLFNDTTAAKIETVYRVKSQRLPGDGINWRIMENDKLMFTVEGIKLTAKERTFLCTVDGCAMLIFLAKEKNLSVQSVKREIKSRLAIKKN